jgi:DNA mismatch repair protein MutL
MLRGNEAEVISKILNSLISLGKEESSKEKVVALSFSKYACIKHGDILIENEMIEIVNRLFGTKKPFVCPSGKSSIVQIPINEIISRFLKN